MTIDELAQFLKNNGYRLTLHALEDLGFLARIALKDKAVQIIDPVASRAIQRVCTIAKERLQA